MYYYPLHASAVGADGRALALADPSETGKSTLAAALSAKGLSVIADDICIIDATDGAYILPSGRCLRLWRDALEHLGIAVEGLPRALSRRGKYLIEGGQGGGLERRRLVAIVPLSRGTGGVLSIERLRGARSIVELYSAVHMLPAARALGLESAVFVALTKLLASGVTVYRLVMLDNWGCLEEAAMKVLALLDA